MGQGEQALNSSPDSQLWSSSMSGVITRFQLKRGGGEEG